MKKSHMLLYQKLWKSVKRINNNNDDDNNNNNNNNFIDNNANY